VKGGRIAALSSLAKSVSSFFTFFTWLLVGREWSASRPDLFTCGETPAVAVACEAGCAPASWMTWGRGSRRHHRDLSVVRPSLGHYIDCSVQTRFSGSAFKIIMSVAGKLQFWSTRGNASGAAGLSSSKSRMIV
jgi:hypothetical protein